MKEKRQNIIDDNNQIELKKIKKEKENKVIMKCNKEYISFDKKNYNPILKDYIPKNEWEIIAEEANNVIGKAYYLRKLQENIKIPEFMSLIFRIIFFFSLADFIFLIIYTKNANFNEIVIYFALSFILIACIIIIILMIYNYIRKLDEEKTIDDFIVEGMKKFINSLNEIYANIVSFKYNHIELEIECTLINKYH